MLELEFLKQDVEALAHNWADIFSLIERNPFSKAISFLLQHPELANKNVLNTKKEIRPPNCLGTSFFIAGVGKFDYPYHAYEDELNEHMKQLGPKRWDDCFLAHLERKIPGAFCFSVDFNADWHSGIYLGKIGDEDVLFAQHGVGKPFGPESSRCYSSPKYYIPRSLRKKI